MPFIRKRRLLISIFASFLLACGLAAGVISSTAIPAAAASTVTISLTNSSSYCANVTGGRNVSGTRIQLWKCSGGNDQWVLQTGVSCVAGTNCYYFKDAANTSLCLSTDLSGNIVLGACNGTGSWYSEGNHHLGNGAYGASYTLASDGASNGDLLYALPSNEIPNGFWWSWNW